MKFVKTLIAILLLLETTPALAMGGKEVGNGGNAVLCPANHSAELLDYYEGRILRGMNVTMGSSKDPVAVAQFVVQRLKKLSPLRALAYEKYINSFINESRFLKGVELIEVPDSGHIFLPNNCKIVQVALQKAPEFPGDGRYVINQDVWDQMPVTSKAGLILHEVIYREALEFGATDSKAVRYLNSALASDQLASHTPATFTEMMVGIGFPAYEEFGTVLVSDGENTVSLDQSKFFEFARPSQVKILDYLFDTRVPGKLKYGSDGSVIHITGSFSHAYQGKDLLLTELSFYKTSHQYQFLKGFIDGDQIEFNFNGGSYKFYKLKGSGEYRLSISEDGALTGLFGNFQIVRGIYKTPGIITTHLHESASISKLGFPERAGNYLSFSAPTKVKTSHGIFVFKGGDRWREYEIELHPLGALASGILEGGQKMKDKLTCEEGAQVKLDESGNVEEFYLREDSQRNCWKGL